MRALRKIALLSFLIGILALVAIQFVPYGRTTTNPPVVSEPAWDAPATRVLFSRACADCHSNETRWPWYSRVAPVSWLVASDVEEGREKFNVSERATGRRDESDEAAEKLTEGEMPLRVYLLAHPEARLSQEERAALIGGLRATFGDRRGRD